jgi:hypothetical protein
LASEDSSTDLDYIEVKQVVSREYVKLKRAAKPDAKLVGKKVKEDDRFKANSKRSGARLAIVIIYAISFLSRIDNVYFNVLALVLFRLPMAKSLAMVGI